MRPLLFDGAFGTYYAAVSGACAYPELANTRDADVVYAIHREYIEAGAQAIKTNTFCANETVLASDGAVRDAIRRGYGIAVMAAEDSGAAVYADMGPDASDGAAAHYLRSAELFLELGATRFLFETLSEVRAVIPAIELIKRQLPSADIITSFAVSRDGYTRAGGCYAELIAQAADAGSDHAGINCICGPAHTLELIRGYRGAASLSAMPNSGYPTTVNGRTVYIDNPEYFGEKLCEIYLAGADIIGGCCGSTPAHIREAARLVAQCPERPARNKESDVRAVRPRTVLCSDRKLIAVELHPPVNTDAGYLLSASRAAKAAGADFVTVPDSPLARTSADSLAVAAKVRRECGMDAIPHLTCRDRNQIALKGGLIAAHIEGVRRVLAVTGDAVSPAERTEVRQASGMDSRRLTAFIESLNADIFAGEPMEVVCALNTSSARFELELARAKQKVAAGASAFFTQPLFSQDNIANLTLARRELTCPIFAGVMPVASYKNALFLNNEVAGIEIPQRLIERLAAAAADEVTELSLDFCRGIVDAAEDICDGYYIVTPMKRMDLTERIIGYIRRDAR